MIFVHFGSFWFIISFISLILLFNIDFCLQIPDPTSTPFLCNVRAMRDTEIGTPHHYLIPSSPAAEGLVKAKPLSFDGGGGISSACHNSSHPLPPGSWLLWLTVGIPFSYPAFSLVLMEPQVFHGWGYVGDGIDLSGTSGGIMDEALEGRVCCVGELLLRQSHAVCMHRTMPKATLQISHWRYWVYLPCS